MKCGCCECCKEDRDRLSKKHIFKQWPEILRADEPDNIKWGNLGVSGTSRKIRSCFTWLISLALIFGSVLAIVFMKDWANQLKEDFHSDTVICPEDIEPERLKSLAWNDQLNDKEDRAGLVHCYCKSISPVKIGKELTPGDFWADVGGQWKMVAQVPAN